MCLAVDCCFAQSASGSSVILSRRNRRNRRALYGDGGLSTPAGRCQSRTRKRSNHFFVPWPDGGCGREAEQKLGADLLRVGPLHSGCFHSPVISDRYHHTHTAESQCRPQSVKSVPQSRAFHRFSSQEAPNSARDNQVVVMVLPWRWWSFVPILAVEPAVSAMPTKPQLDRCMSLGWTRHPISVASPKRPAYFFRIYGLRDVVCFFFFFLRLLQLASLAWIISFLVRLESLLAGLLVLGPFTFGGERENFRTMGNPWGKNQMGVERPWET